MTHLILPFKVGRGPRRTWECASLSQGWDWPWAPTAGLWIRLCLGKGLCFPRAVPGQWLSMLGVPRQAAFWATHDSDGWLTLKSASKICLNFLRLALQSKAYSSFPQKKKKKKKEKFMNSVCMVVSEHSQPPPSSSHSLLPHTWLVYLISSWCLLLAEPHLTQLDFFFFFFFCLFAFSRAAPVAYGGSQTRGLIGAVAAGLCHSHSNTRSKLRLWPTLQLTATLDP